MFDRRAALRDLVQYAFSLLPTAVIIHGPGRGEYKFQMDKKVRVEYTMTGYSLSSHLFLDLLEIPLDDEFVDAFNLLIAEIVPEMSAISLEDTITRLESRIQQSDIDLPLLGNYL